MKLNRKSLKRLILKEIKNLNLISEGSVSFTFSKHSPYFKDKKRSKDITFYIIYNFDSSTSKVEIKSVSDGSGTEYTDDTFWDQLFNDKTGLTTAQISEIEVQIRRKEESRGNKVKNIHWPW